MTTLLEESFANLGDGVAPSASNTGYDAFVFPASGALEGDSAVSVTSPNSLRVYSADGSRMLVKFTTTSTNVLGNRLYVRPRTISAAEYIADIYGSGTRRADIRINADLTMAVRDQWTAVVTSTAALTLDEWSRVEWSLDAGAGEQTLRMFVGANLHGDTPDFEGSGAYTQGAMDVINLGMPAAGAAFEINVDDHKIVDTYGQIGPSIQPTPDSGIYQQVGGVLEKIAYLRQQGGVLVQ